LDRRSLLNPGVLGSLALTAASFFVQPPYRLILLVISPVPLLLWLIYVTLKRRVILGEVDDRMLFLLARMYLISTGEPPKEKLFEVESVTGYSYDPYGSYLRDISVLAREWGYGFVNAIRLYLNKVRNFFFRDFLARLAEAISVGEDLKLFLRTEYETAFEEYEARYARTLELNKVLMGVYSATVSSVLFINVNMLLLSILFWGGPLLSILSLIAGVAALAVLTYIMYRILPKEPLLHDMEGFPERKVYLYMLLTSVISGTLMGLTIVRMLSSTYYFFASLGAFLLLPGVVAYRIERKIKRIESFYRVFVRSFGLTYSSVRSYRVALRSILRVEMGDLTPIVKRLYSRLLNGVDKALAWRLFAAESGSEYIRRCTDILYAASESGGDMSQTGYTLSSMLLRLDNLRKQRLQTARAFQSVIYVLHILMVALTEFIVALVLLLQQALSVLGAMPIQIISITPIEPGLLQLIKLVLIASTTMINAAAMKVSEGGFMGTMWLHVGSLMLISSLVSAVMSASSQVLLKMFPVEEITTLP